MSGLWLDPGQTPLAGASIRWYLPYLPCTRHCTARLSASATRCTRPMDAACALGLRRPGCRANTSKPRPQVAVQSTRTDAPGRSSGLLQGRSTPTCAYCDHQENRKSVIGRDHLRVPSVVPLPASGLSAASGLSIIIIARGRPRCEHSETVKEGGSRGRRGDDHDRAGRTGTSVGM
jgi:hypothetical protein